MIGWCFQITHVFLIFTPDPWEIFFQFDVRIFFFNGLKLNHHLEIGNFTPKKPPEVQHRHSPWKVTGKPNFRKYSVKPTIHHFFRANFAVENFVVVLKKKIRCFLSKDPTYQDSRAGIFPVDFCFFHFSAPHLAGGQRSGDLQLRGGRWVVPWCLDWWNPVGPLISATRDAYLKRLEMHRRSWNTWRVLRKLKWYMIYVWYRFEYRTWDIFLKAWLNKWIKCVLREI